MKKQVNKLSLNKRTVSNLETTQMLNRLGGNPTYGHNCVSRECTGGCSTFCTYGCTQTCREVPTCYHPCTHGCIYLT